MTGISTRRADVGDLEALVALFDGYRRFYSQPSQPELCREFLRARMERSESAIFLALSPEEKALGFTQLYPGFSSVQLRPVWQLNDLYVHPHARGRGAGLSLLDAARGHARATGAAWLILETGAENTYAQGLYERYGYARMDPDRRFYQLDLND